MKSLFIINPASVRQKLESIKSSLKNIFDEKVDVVVTEYQGHAEELIKSNKEDKVIFSVGGDGSFREIVNGVGKLIENNNFLINESENYISQNNEKNTTVPSIGVLPMGSGNDFARSIFENMDYNYILSEFSNGRWEKSSIDLGKTNEGYFVNIASIGFDAEIVHNAERYKNKKILRKFSYILSIFYTLFHYKGIDLKVKIGTEEFNEKTLLLAVANGKYYGGGIKIAPDANISDGFFDVYYIPMQNRMKILFLLPRLLNGSHTRLSFVKHFTATSVYAESKDETFLLNLDGDLIPETKASFDIIPSCLNIVTVK